MSAYMRYERVRNGSLEISLEYCSSANLIQKSLLQKKEEEEDRQRRHLFFFLKDFVLSSLCVVCASH